MEKKWYVYGILILVIIGLFIIITVQDVKLQNKSQKSEQFDDRCYWIDIAYIQEKLIISSTDYLIDYCDVNIKRQDRWEHLQEEQIKCGGKI